MWPPNLTGWASNSFKSNDSSTPGNRVAVIVPFAGWSRMRSIVFANADQLSLGDLDVGQFAGAKFGEEVAVGHGLGRFDWEQLQNEVERQQEQYDVDDCKYPSVLLLAFHRACFMHACGQPLSPLKIWC